MAGKLKDEIKQTRPFRSREQEAFLNLLRTCQVLSESVEGVLKSFGLSTTQYNVLRILRGAGPDGLACGEIGERMVNRDPDITRLLDRIGKLGWISRERSKTDRRVVLATISKAGLDLLSKIDDPLAEHLEKMLGRLGKTKLETLIDLLEEARSVDPK